MRRADLSGECNLALAVLWQAVKDARDQGSPYQDERISAVVFLASNRATLWFDMADLEQFPALEKMEWHKYAQDLLDDPEVELTKPQLQLLQKGIKIMSNG